jgi:nucleotide-binding universal stress UspA family protein
MKRFKNILLYAGMEQNEAAVNRSVTLAIENDAKLTLMDVVKPVPRALGMLTHIGDSEELQQLIAKDHRHRLLKIASEYVDTGVPIDIVVATGDPATEIVRQVLTDEHDLVVKTADVSVAGRVFGSVARSLLRICPCPLWLLKPEIHGDFDRVLAAVDLEAADEAHLGLNRNIMELAFSIAQRENAQLHLVSAWDLWMEKALRRRAGDAEVDAALASHEKEVHRALDDLLQVPNARIEEFHTYLRRGNPASVIQSIAEEMEADLMVMGTVCRTGAAGFMIGNTAETVLSSATCSILALKPQGFVTPIEMADHEAAKHSEQASAQERT